MAAPDLPLCRPALGWDLYRCFGVVDADGDTTHVAVYRQGFNQSAEGVTFRFLAEDAFESGLHQRSTGPEVTPEEIELGKIAAKAVSELIASGTLYAIPGTKSGKWYDSFGRRLAWMYVVKPDGTVINVALWMHDNNHVRAVWIGLPLLRKQEELWNEMAERLK